jgi:RNA polymerase sigma factor (sigma-70 family)
VKIVRRSTTFWRSGNNIIHGAVSNFDRIQWERTLPDDQKLARFERVIVPHLDAAYNLARWLTGKDHDAEDVVQEAYLRAFQFFGGFLGTDGRAWLLAIVRNTSYTWLEKNRRRQPTASFDEAEHSAALPVVSPESVLVRMEDQKMLHQALAELPTEFREVIVLRELEGLSYQQIATIAAIPLGTVMSRLARARQRLEECLVGMNKE